MKWIISKLLRFRHIIIDSKSVSYTNVNNMIRNYKGKPGLEIYIKESTVSGALLEEGCKLVDVKVTGNVKCGRYVSINGPGTRIGSKVSHISIGSFTSIASNVIIQENNHHTNHASTYYIHSNIIQDDRYKDYTSKGPISIGEDVWIGSNVVITSGVSIGRGAIIGAGSIVTKDVVAYSIVGGNPAKLIRMRFGTDEISELEKSRWWLWNEETIKENVNFFDRIRN